MSDAKRPRLADGHVVVTGSLAFDNIMDFPGHFKDHIRAEKAHVISISFLVEKMTRQRGGCAANIAYTMSLLGTPARIVAAAGHDFGDYQSWLAEQGIDVSGIHIFEDEMTASCFITTDQADCQITGFHMGAMKRAREISLNSSAGNGAALAVIAPDDPEAMLRHCQEARDAHLPFLFDPSFQVTALDGEFLATASRGAMALAMNDYEFTVFREKTGTTVDDLRRDHEMVLVTYGAKGSEILLADGGTVSIPAAKAGEVVDPTGAGDAFRGGFVAGLQQGYDLEVCGRMASLAAVYAIESYGTVSHAYSREEFFQRYAESFGQAPAA